MRSLVVILALIGIGGTAEAREAQAGPKKQTPSIMVEYVKQSQKVTKQKASRPQATKAKRTRTAKSRPGPTRSSSIPYLYVTSGRREVNDAGRNQQLQNDYLLRRQQYEIQRQTETNLLRREIEQMRNAPVRSPYIGCAPGSLRC